MQLVVMVILALMIWFPFFQQESKTYKNNNMNDEKIKEFDDVIK